MAEIEMIVPLLFVGIDWGSREHRVAVLDAAGKQVRDWTVEHTGAELVDLVERLAALVQGAVTRCQVGIELKSGPIVEMLIERGFTVFAVNPKQTDRFRDRYMPSGAKDDRRDALVLASAVRTDSEHLTRLSKTDSRTIELRAMLRLRDELVGD
jgi:transposase